MGNRLIFLYHLEIVISEGATQEDTDSVPMEEYVQAVRVLDR